MSLNVFRTEDEVKRYGLRLCCLNDRYFDLNTQLRSTDFVKSVLNDVDKGSFHSKNEYKDRHDSVVPRSYLSTGAKTLLNIDSNETICFDVLECGNNALVLLGRLHHGNVLWRCPVVSCDADVECDILCSGKHYTKLRDLTNDVLKEGEPSAFNR